MDKKPIHVFESDYNKLTHIAKLVGTVHQAGSPLAGRMDPAKTIEHVLKIYEGVMR